MAGINKTLYNDKNELDIMLTKEEVMENLHLKNYRSFIKLIEKEKLPYIKIGRKYLVPLSEFNKWKKRIIYN